MSEVHTRTVYDESMRPVAVQIPYNEWLKIEKQLRNIERSDKVDLSRFSGSIQLSEDPLAYQRKSRQEWQ